MGASTEVPTYESVSYPDLGIGLLAYSEIYWGGFSYDHITEPNHSLMGGYIALQKKFTMFGGYKYLINGRLGTVNEESLTASFLFRSQSKYDQLDFGTYWNKKPLIVGVWYRGIPLFKAYKRGYQNNDSFAVLLGYQLPLCVYLFLIVLYLFRLPLPLLFRSRIFRLLLRLLFW